MTEQLTNEERKALYAARKGKKQKRLVRVVFRSKQVTAQKGLSDREGEVLRTTHTASAVRGEKGQYVYVGHKPVLEILAGTK
jgi:hypothetical protein